MGIAKKATCPALLLLASLAVVTRAEDAGDPATRPAESVDRSAVIVASLRSAMKRPVSLDLKNEPLDRAVAGLSRQVLVPIGVDWHGLQELGIDRNAPVTLRLRDVPADHLLALLLRSANRSPPPIWFDAGGVHVALESPPLTSHDGDPPARVVEVAYDVPDLLRLAPRWFNSREEVYEILTRLIEISVKDDSWRDNGGQTGSIRVGLAKPRDDDAKDANPPPQAPVRHPGIPEPLVVTTTPEIQEEVAALLSSLRDGLAGRPQPRTLAYDRAVQALKRPVPAAFKALPLGDILESLRRTSNANLFIDWKGLEAAGFYRDALITVHAPRGTLPAGEALSAALASAAGGPDRLRFEISPDGVVEISTAEALTRITELRCYSLHPLLATRRPSKYWTPQDDAGQRIEAIAKRIEEAVEPESWRETGGAVGSLKVFAWTLVVTQTPTNQEKVDAVLRAMP